MHFTTRFKRTGKWWLFAIITAIGLSVLLLLDNQIITDEQRERHELLLSEKMAQIPEYSSEEMKNIPKPAQPDKAAVQDYFMTFDPETGVVPKERLMQAYQKLQKNPQEKSGNLLQWNSTEANMGGRTRAIMWDPNDPTGNKVWAGGVTGGLWYRNDITNDNDPWQPVDDFWSTLSISCITFDPNDPMTFYVGTGEAETALIIYRESSGIGEGIWRSNDGGISWELMESTLGFEYVTDMVVRDEDGLSVIYAGVVSGVYKGSIHYSDPSDGLFRSEDGGLTWEQVLPDIPGYGDPYAVADIELGADGRIYVGTMQNVDIEGGAVILHSDDGFSGTWTVFDQYAEYIQNHSQYNIPGRVMVAPAPSDANVVYAAIAAGYNNYFNYYRGRYVLKSTDKGQTWNTLTVPDSDWSTLAWHAFTINVAPDNANHVFTGGLDMWKSNNGGSTWNRISDWALMYSGGGDQYLHADQHDIQFKPGDPDVFITCNDGGVFYTQSASFGYPVFMEKNQGYNTLQFYTGAIHPQEGATIYCGGLQDNGTLLYDGGPLSINDMISGGDGAACFFDDVIEMLLTSIYYNRYYLFINYNYQDYLDYYSGVFINPADYDVNNNILFANAVSFSGSMPNTLLRISDMPFGNNGDFIGLNTNTNVYFSHIKASPHAPAGTANIFVGTQSGRVYKVTQAHASPQTTEITGNDFPLGYVSCIAVGSSEDVLLVTFSNYGVESLWQTLDGGITWTNVQGDLPDIPVRWALYHPENDNQVMLATELGIWTTNLVNAPEVNWVQDAAGMANVRVDMLDLRAADNTVLAATHGRGLYTAEFLLDPGVAVHNPVEKEIRVFPNPSDGILQLDLTSFGQLVVDVTMTDITGKIVLDKTVTAGYIETFDLRHLPKGSYLLLISGSNDRMQTKVVLQ